MSERYRDFIAVAGLLGVVLVLSACNRRDPLAPPEIRYGEDVCHVCSMIISDDRYAAAAIHLDENADHQALMFDDIGCLLVLETEPAAESIAARYVRDFVSRGWLDLETASYVHSDELRSPMAFGVAAVDTRAAAETLSGEYPGDVLDAAGLRARFAEGLLTIQPARDQAADDAVPDEAATAPAAPDMPPPRAMDAAGRIWRFGRPDTGAGCILSLLEPEQAVQGVQDFELAIASEGRRGQLELVDNVTIRIEPRMPDMGHGSSGNEHPTYVGEGRYRGRVNFSMPGRWVVGVTVSYADQTLARLEFDFLVE